MGKSQANLAALLGSRICHDLISPIGAINNGLELLGMTGEVMGPEIDLIRDSVGNASARIRFFRIAFGSAGEQMVGRSETISVMGDYLQTGRISASWNPREPQSREELRLAFLAFLCLESAMPYGGDVQIDQSAGQWVLTGSAEKFNISDALWAVIDGAEPPEELQPAHLQFALLPLVAGDAGRQVLINRPPGQIELCF